MFNELTLPKSHNLPRNMLPKVSSNQKKGWKRETCHKDYKKKRQLIPPTFLFNSKKSYIGMTVYGKGES